MDEVEAQRPDEVDVVVGELPLGPPLGEVIDGDDGGRDGDQRPERPPVLHFTHRAAYGRALSRSFGMFSWHFSHTP